MGKEKIKVYLSPTYEAATYPEVRANDLKDWMGRMMDNGATHFEFSGFADDYSVSEIEIQALYFREETVDEYKTRVKKEAAEKLEREKSQYERQKRQYEELKKIFEKEPQS